MFPNCKGYWFLTFDSVVIVLAFNDSWRAGLPYGLEGNAWQGQHVQQGGRGVAAAGAGAATATLHLPDGLGETNQSLYIAHKMTDIEKSDSKQIILLMCLRDIQLKKCVCNRCAERICRG